LRKFKHKKRKILAWMPPEGSRRQQILSAVYVPLQPGHPLSPGYQVNTQIPSKMHGLLHRATEQDRFDFLNRLDLLGLLPPDLTSKTPVAELALQITEGNPELMVYLRPGHVERIEEVPGAREILEKTTLMDWLKELEKEVEGR